MSGWGCYRKKPVVIDAIHWRENLTPPEAHALTNIIEHEWGYPWLVGDALRPDTLRCESQPHASERPTKGLWIDPADGALMIRTLEGDMKVSLGDYIIRGVQGEVYPCKPDIFAATYEPADVLAAFVVAHAIHDRKGNPSGLTPGGRAWPAALAALNQKETR